MDVKPRFAPSGKGVIFLVEGDLWHVGLSRDGRALGSPRVLRSGLRAIDWGASRDGQRLMYVTRDISYTLQLRTTRSMSDTTGGVTRVLASGTASIAGRASPDERLVAYVQAGNVHIVTLADGRDEQITSDGLVAGSPVWSPDGTRLAFTVKLDDSLRVRTLVVASGEIRTFRSSAPSSRELTWAPGARIVYQTGAMHYLSFIDPVSGAEQPFVTPGTKDTAGFMWSPAYSLDGKRIALWRNANPPAIWTINADGRGLRKLRDNIRALPRAWSAQADTIYAVTTKGRLVTVPLDPTKPVTTLPLPFPKADGMTCQSLILRQTHGWLCSAVNQHSDAWIVDHVRLTR